MTSQMGSLPRPARSAPENARSVATGTVRSAMLTYLGQIVIQQEAATKGSYPRPRPERIAPEAQARSHGRAETYRVSARDAKAEGRTRVRNWTGLPEEESPWQNNRMTAWRG